jgi:predicted enzyme related to lactoylglutathione lyase
MAVTRIIAHLPASNPMALAKFYAKVFALDLPFDMEWIAFLNTETAQKIELHTASKGSSGTELPVISIGVEDLDATEVAVRAAGAVVIYGHVREAWGLRRFFFRDRRSSTSSGSSSTSSVTPIPAIAACTRTGSKSSACSPWPISTSCAYISLTDRITALTIQKRSGKPQNGGGVGENPCSTPKAICRQDRHGEEIRVWRSTPPEFLHAQRFLR